MSSRIAWSKQIEVRGRTGGADCEHKSSMLNHYNRNGQEFQLLPAELGVYVFW